MILCHNCRYKKECTMSDKNLDRCYDYERDKEEKTMMYLVEGRNRHETRGQYVLTEESAYAIAEEMKNDFVKVNIYKKENGEYKRIEKIEREETNYDWLNSLSLEEQANAMADIAFKVATYYNQCRKPDNRLYTKDFWLEWLKEKHNVE